MGTAGRVIWAILAAAEVAALGAGIAGAAEPEALRGDRFITVMKNNTLSGGTDGGARFDMYFLPGGLVTYRDSAGDDDRGRWRIDDDGDVCISWTSSDQEHCFRVTLEGDTVSWQGKSGSGRARLRGGITDGKLAARSG
jgi:hypothetical protein